MSTDSDLLSETSLEAFCMVLLGVSSTMSYQGSPYSGGQDEYDFEDDGYDDIDEFREQGEPLPPLPADDSDEDTEEASETDVPNNDEPLEFKEQMYKDKLANLRKQLQLLKEHIHPEYLKRIKRLEHQLNERLRLNKIYQDHMLVVTEREFEAEKRAAAKEFEEKKIELKENLISDFEDKRKIIESERHSMELNGDSMEVKPVMKRILRRRANEPAPVPEKRRKPLATTLLYLLDDRDIECDLRAVTVRPPSPRNHTNNVQQRKNNNRCSQERDQRDAREPVEVSDMRVEDGKLLYERRWFHRGQSVYVESRDQARFAGHIHSITDEAIWVKKINSDKVKIYTSHLARGKITLKRRAS